MRRYAKISYLTKTVNDLNCLVWRVKRKLLKEAWMLAIETLSWMEMRKLSERLALAKTIKQLNIKDSNAVRFAHRLVCETVRRRNFIDKFINNVLKPDAIGEFNLGVQAFLRLYVYQTRIAKNWAEVDVEKAENITQLARSILGWKTLQEVERVLGVAKAYTTRVGQGPFPTEDSGQLGKMLRDSGAEFGSTTGRPRRCGPFDAPLVRYAARINGANEMVLTKLDVLSGLDKIRIAVGYKQSKEFDPFVGEDLEPEYLAVPGFETDISGARERKDLPGAAIDYVKLIEEHTGLVVSYVSVGPERDAVVKM